MTAERKRADTVGAAGGVGDSESVAVKDSLWPQGVEAVVNPQLAREVTEDWSERRLQSIDPKAEAVFSRSGEKRSHGQKCSESAMPGMQATEVMSGRKP